MIRVLETSANSIPSLESHCNSCRKEKQREFYVKMQSVPVKIPLTNGAPDVRRSFPRRRFSRSTDMPTA